MVKVECKWIGEYIPNDIETYVGFLVVLWVYVNGDIYEKPKLKEVIYNDFNRYIVNLFECRTPEKFYKYMIDLQDRMKNCSINFKRNI